MLYVFSNEGHRAIEELARRAAVLVFDFDGTLAPVVSGSRDARIRWHTRALLRIAAVQFPSAVISDRPRAELAEHVGTIRLLAVVGNDGAERDGSGPAANVDAPVCAPTRRDAVALIAAAYSDRPVVYVSGNDRDENVFHSHTVTHSIRVGHSPRTAARYYLEDQAEVDRLLWALVNAGARESRLGDVWKELDPDATKVRRGE